MPIDAGYGWISIITPTKLIPYSCSEISVETETEEKQSFAFPVASVGPVSVAEVFGGTSTTKISLTTEKIDRISLELFYGVVPASVASATTPKEIFFTVPATTPFEVSVTGLTLNQPLKVTLLKEVSPGNISLIQVTTAPSAATEFQVTPGKIVFAAAQASVTGLAAFTVTGALTNAVGGSVANLPIGNIQLYFKRKFSLTPERTCWYPSCTVPKGNNLDRPGDSRVIVLTAKIPAGDTEPFLEYDD